PTSFACRRRKIVRTSRTTILPVFLFRISVVRASSLLETTVSGCSAIDGSSQAYSLPSRWRMRLVVSEAPSARTLYKVENLAFPVRLVADGLSFGKRASVIPGLCRRHLPGTYRLAKAACRQERRSHPSSHGQRCVKCPRQASRKG